MSSALRKSRIDPQQGINVWRELKRYIRDTKSFSLPTIKMSMFSKGQLAE